MHSAIGTEYVVETLLCSMPARFRLVQGPGHLCRFNDCKVKATALESMESLDDLLNVMGRPESFFDPALRKITSDMPNWIP